MFITCVFRFPFEAFLNLNAAMENAVTNGKLFSKTPVKCAVGGIYLSVSLADPFFLKQKSRFANMSFCLKDIDFQHQPGFK